VKIILLSDGGGARTFPMRKQFFALIAAVVALPLVLILIAQQTPADLSDHPVVSDWRAKLDQQKTRLRTLRLRSQAQSEAMGRQLALLQARLTRMEALGLRVAEVAQLDTAEFNFREPPALGGPAVDNGNPSQRNGANETQTSLAYAPSSEAQALPFAGLDQSLESLSAASLSAERQLEVLESLLRDKDYQQAKSLSGRPILWGWMSSPYGERVDPISGKKAWHKGVDFAGKAGSDVVAVAGGVVTYAGKRYGYGILVEITHSDGYVTRYGHHQKVLVQVGDVVKRGRVIALMGSSGRSTGPHVHFEVFKDGRRVDPAKYVALRK
jgi:murein DD-endopeptidase MepM/ murein hydrolase activator NlpD